MEEESGRVANSGTAISRNFAERQQNARKLRNGRNLRIKHTAKAPTPFSVP
jgi:hypothetical protein